jgi:hypothetical protein
MWRITLFAVAEAAVVALVAKTTDAMAGSSTSTETGKQHARSAAHSTAQHNHQHAAHRTFTHALSNHAGAYYPVLRKVLAFRGQGHVYVPRKGIADEPCNLPAGACPNEMHDVQ